MENLGESNGAIAEQGSTPTWEIWQGDAFDLFDRLEPETVDLVITSPPYWGLRSYGLAHNWNIWKEWICDHGKEEIPAYDWYRDHGGCLGLEPTADWYASNVSCIMSKAWRVLKKRGSLWLNVGDTYFARWSSIRPRGRQGLAGPERDRRRTPMGGYRQEKQLLLIPARTAIQMQGRGWILRNDLIWYKPNVPPRHEKDRLPLTHEHFYHFVKKPTEGRAAYYYDKSEVESAGHDVIKVNVARGADGHSATFPPALIRPRILSSCPTNGLVLDPFAGTGTALSVAVEHGRRALGFEITERFATTARLGLQRVNRVLF